ncbi:MAG: thioredoxin family protein [Planctomycetaceae bacterium]
MKRPILTFGLVGCLAIGGYFGLRAFAAEPGSEAIQWHSDIFKAHDVSVKTDRPMLILISSEGCPPCLKLKSSTLSDPRIARFVNQAFVPVKLDFEKDARIIEILEVEHIPTTVVLSPEADLLGRLVGYASVQDYYKALDKTRQIQGKIDSLRQAAATKKN